MGYCVLDIETVPLKIEDDDIIEYLMDKKFTRGLHPVFSKIIVIGVKEEDEDPIIFYGDDEPEIIKKFWKFFYEKRPNLIVTFNGYKFDIPFIYIRSLINKIELTPTVGINQNKWRLEQSNHYDLMLAFSGIDSFQWVSLEILCRMNGITVSDNRTDYEDIEESYKKSEWDPIIEHNKQDLVMTEELYKKILV